jgi:tetratricopeptide (TPR) repeat protein
MNLKIRILFLLLFIPLLALSQAADSLRVKLDQHINTYGEDTVALSILKQIFILTKDNQQDALEVAGQALQIADKFDLKTDEGIILQWIADIYRQQKVYYLAMDYYFKAVKLFHEANDEKNEANCYIELGKTYIEQNVEDLALQYFNKAKDIYTKNKDAEGVTLALKSIGELFFRQESYDLAKEQYQNALNSLPDTSKSVAELLLSIAKVQIEKEDYELAIEYLHKALVRYKAMNNMQQVADIYTQYGEVYMNQKENEKALTNFENALFINRELQDFNTITQTYNKIAYIYYRSEKYKQAIEQLQYSLNYNDNFLNEMETSYLYLSRSYEKLNNSKEALSYIKKYLRVHDQIADDKDNKRFNEMQVSLELQRHEKELELLKRDQDIQNEALKRSKLQTYFLLFGVLVLLLFAFYYYVNNQRTKKANREILRQKEELTQANESILKQQVLIQKKNKDIEAGISYAHRIQFALIPEVAELTKILPKSLVYLKPKDQISGDFYWFRRKRHLNKVFLAAIDCTGHGVPGAFMSVLGDTLLNQIVNAGLFEADEILQSLHKLVRQALHQETTPNRDGMDMAICVIDTENRYVDFAGAKNPLIYFIDNEVFQIKGDLFSIGGIQREKIRLFTKHRIEIPKDKEATFYMFSDGFQDQFGGEFKQKFTRNKVRELLQEIHALDFKEQFTQIDSRFNEWKGQYEQLDDVIIVGFKV